MTRILVLLGLLLLSACGKEVVNPPAKPLSAAVESLAEIPALGRGEYQVATIDPVVFATPGRNTELPVRIVYPVETSLDDALPLIVFSHGNWSDREKYDNLLRHWASHGYVVVAPTHLDGRSMARGIFNSLRYGQMGLIDGRVEDVQFLLDHLPELEKELAAGSGRELILNQDAVAIAGHSFGAFTAEQFAGAKAIDDEAGDESLAFDSRVKAVLAISPPGPMFDIINDRSWLEMKGPVLVTTGTWDSNPQFWPDWRMHLMSHDTALPGQQYALVIDGADHYLGNLICRPEREAAPQNDALLMLNAVSVSFFNANLRNDATAKAFLESDKLESITGGFAVLKNR